MDISQNRTPVKSSVQAAFRRFRAARLLLLGAFLGGLTGLPARAFAGELPMPHFASSETDSLNLTPQQKQRLAALEGASRAQAHQLIGQIEKLRHTLSEAYEVYTVDVAAIRRTDQDLNRVQAQLLDLRLSEQIQLRQILSASQFAQLQTAIHKHGPDDDDRRHDSEERHGSRN